MSETTFALRVFHPSVDPRRITEELGLPPQISWQAGNDKSTSYWQTQLVGDESGRGTLASALHDIAARFEPYRFFIDEIRAGHGRVEIVVSHAPIGLDEELWAAFAKLRISLKFSQANLTREQLVQRLCEYDDQDVAKIAIDMIEGGANQSRASQISVSEALHIWGTRLTISEKITHKHIPGLSSFVDAIKNKGPTDYLEQYVFRGTSPVICFVDISNGRLVGIVCGIRKNDGEAEPS